MNAHKHLHARGEWTDEKFTLQAVVRLGDAADGSFLVVASESRIGSFTAYVM
jgi:hypothetical protein